MTPDDIALREAERVLDLLTPEDRESIEAYVHLERRRAAARVEWLGTFLGALGIGIIVLIAIPMGSCIYADTTLGLNEAINRANAADARAAAIGKQCLGRVVPNEGGTP